MNIDVYSGKDLQSWSKDDLIKHILFLQVVTLQTELENFKTVQTDEDMNKEYIDKSILLKEINDNIAYYKCAATCSISESMHGERIYKEFLEFVNKLPTKTFKGD